MPDDLSQRGSADRSRVNVQEAHEVHYWTRKFGCSEQQLKEAVSRVGVDASDVEAYLTSYAAQGPTKGP
jgi:hypothetical protein